MLRFSSLITHCHTLLHIGEDNYLDQSIETKQLDELKQKIQISADIQLLESPIPAAAAVSNKKRQVTISREPSVVA